MASASLPPAPALDGASRLPRLDSAPARARIPLAHSDDVRADAGRLRLAWRSVAALPEPARAARGLDTLPRLRPLRRQLGGARRAAGRHPSPVSRPLFDIDVPLRPRRATALLHTARFDKAQARG